MTDYRSKTDAEWKNDLSDAVYRVCRKRNTEKAFSGQYDKFNQKGTYACACCGGDYPLFSSDAKFDSGTGWPSFWEPISPNSVELVAEDNLSLNHYYGAKIEVRCNRCGSHLGHVFNDGPADKTGKRYCMNSVALAFTPSYKEVKETNPAPTEEVAIFAGGCFWCGESVFEDLPGVISVISGFTGGASANPTYEDVSAGGTGHLESIQITFNPQKISYEQLLDVFWHNVDPFDPDGQFCDKGDSYKAAIFYKSKAQQEKAETSKKKLQASFKSPIVTGVREAERFYPAEDYHQSYAKKNPIRYQYYRWRCGRDERLAEIWNIKPQPQETLFDFNGFP
ncbi:MAG: peptide-methionine (S)-S-oxide reductase MsrA [Alphaproteobacteria bacterium]